MKFDLSKQVESRLNLQPNKETFGLALAELESVEVKTYEVAKIDDKGSESKSEFKGCIVPRISFTWRNHKTSQDEEDRFYTLSFGVVATIKNDGTPISKKVIESIYETMYSNMMHIHNAYKKSANYKPITSLPDIDEMATPELRAKQTELFFNAFASAFNGVDGKSVFVDQLGISIPVWLKLVAEYTKGDKFVTPTFVGQGFTEIAIKLTDGKWKKPLIELKPQETIELTATSSKKPSSVNISTQQGGIDPAIQAILDQNN